MTRHWVILVTGIIGCSDKGALRYRPRRDGVHHYVMTMRYTREDAGIVSALPRSSQAWTIYYTQFGRFTDLRGAGSEVSLQIDSVQSAGADARELRRLQGQNISVFLDGRGRLLRTERDASTNLTPAMVLRLHAMAAATAPAFPQEPVEAGDHWTMAARSALEDFGLSGDTLTELPLDATLTAVRESGNDKIAEVGIHGALPPQESGVRTSLGPLPARSSGTVIGQYKFSLRRGVMISQELTGRLTLVTDVPMVGRDTLLSRLVTQTTIRLQ